MDVEYDEDVGNPQLPECPINIARSEELFEMTQRALEWKTPADGDATRAVTPIANFERMVRKAPVPDPTKLSRVIGMTRCLHLHDYLVPALTLLMENGLGEKDDNDDDDLVVYENLDQLLQRCDEVMQLVLDDPTVVIDDASMFDSFEDLSPANAQLNWLLPVDLQQLTGKTKDLTLYSEYKMMLGPCALNADRLANGSQLRMVVTSSVGAPEGGLLAHAMRMHFGLDQNVPADFLSDQVGDFLFNTRWISPYDYAFDTSKEYAMDLPQRAKWPRATREEWLAIAMNKITRVLERADKVSTLRAIFLDDANDATT
jgi:hypothetical protein